MTVTPLERCLDYDQMLSAIEGFSEAFIAFDGDLAFKYLNAAAEHLLDRDRGELLGRSYLEAIPSARGSVFEDAAERCLAEGSRVDFQTFFGTSHAAHWYEVHVSPAEGGLTIHLRALDLVDEATAEKDRVLREINHRMKNSLAVISSLVSLERDSVIDEAAREGLERLHGRIHATGLLYDKLARAQEPESIDAAEYIADLAALVDENFSTAEKRVRLELALSKIELDSERAAALGLVANEAMTNSYKYAFAGARRGLLKVELAVSGKKAIFAVEDDGPGFPAGFDPLRDGDIGFALMADKARELGGLLSTRSGEGGRGARVEIAFPLR